MFDGISSPWQHEEKMLPIFTAQSQQDLKTTAVKVATAVLFQLYFTVYS
jgi:hypothetical protein